MPLVLNQLNKQNTLDINKQRSKLAQEEQITQRQQSELLEQTKGDEARKTESVKAQNATELAKLQSGLTIDRFKYTYSPEFLKGVATALAGGAAAGAAKGYFTQKFKDSGKHNNNNNGNNNNKPSGTAPLTPENKVWEWLKDGQKTPKSDRQSRPAWVNTDRVILTPEQQKQKYALEQVEYWNQQIHKTNSFPLPGFHTVSVPILTLL